ncbi:hypothetical protein [Acinetobacter sp. MB5]|uniref:hypothetical protein n=1 Tax=Acinetobacter sp. MB5 TaxID=2069438 RepID=UPI000DD031FE|nr:hypothetical protein [Acinetobacter sp. MB5]
MAISTLITILGIIALVIYFRLSSKNRQWHLDKNGVMNHNRIEYTPFFKIDEQDFQWIPDVVKKYFPEGHCTVKKYGSGAKNILIVNSSIYYHQYLIREEGTDELLLHGWGTIMDSIWYVEMRDNNSYCMYLFRPCELLVENHYVFFKGRFVEGTIADLKKGFDAWQAAQKDFVKKHQDSINILKNNIIANQKQYDTEVYKHPEYH